MYSTLLSIISRINKNDTDDDKKQTYFKLKKILLEKNITSQVVYKENILKSNFKLFFTKYWSSYSI